MTVTWLGGNGRWINGALWSSGAIPSPADTALIAASGIYTVTVDSSVAAQSVTLDAPGATLAVQGTSTVSTALYVPGGVLALQAGTLSLTTGGVLSGATVAAQGGTLVASGGALAGVTWQGALALGGSSNTLQFADGLQFSGAGGLGPGALELYGSANYLDALDNETLDNVAITVASPTTDIASLGSLTFGPRLSLADAGSLSIVASGFTNNGAINATQGSLSITGNFLNTGIVSTGTAGTIDYNGASLGNSGTLTLALASAMNIAGVQGLGPTVGASVTNTGLVQVNGVLDMTLQNLLNSGTIAIGSGGTVEASFLAPPSTSIGVIQIARGGTLEVALSAVLAANALGTITGGGGTLDLTQGALDDTGGTLAVGSVGTLTDVALSGGAILHGGTILAAPAATFTVNGTLDGVTWVGALSLPTTPTGYNILTLQDGFTLLPAAGSAMVALNLPAAGESLTLNGASLEHVAINTGATLVLAGNLTIDASTVLNAASGSTVITSALGATAGTLTLKGVNYATASGGSLTLGVPTTNNGTLIIGNGDIVSVGSLAGTGVIQLGTGELSITGGASASQTIRFNGPGGTLALTPQLLSSGSVLAAVQNFGSGDTLDLGPISADQVTYQSGNLVFTRQGTLTATVPFSQTFSGTFGASAFQLVSDGSGGVDVTTTVPGAAATPGPTITESDIVGTPTLSPLAGVSVTDANPSALDSVTVTAYSVVAGTLQLSGKTNITNPGAGGESLGDVYVAAGTAGALSAGLQGLVYTQANLGTSVTQTRFVISASNASGTTTTTENATLVAQYGALALAAPSSIAFATSPDGTAFAAPVAGKNNEAVVTAPASGGVFVAPSGFQAEYLGGGGNATLIDPGYGGVLLAGNSGNDLIYARGQNDTVVGGSGTDTMIATGAATIQSLATFGTALIVGGGGTTSIQGPAGGALSTIVAGGGNTAITTGGQANLVALGGGTDTVVSLATDTIFAGAGADSIVTSSQSTLGSAVVALGSGSATVVADGPSDTVFGGSGPATVSLVNSDLYLGGVGTASIVAFGASTVLGGSGAITVFGGGLFKGGGNGGNFLDLTSNSAGGIAYGAAGGDTLVSHGAGSFSNQLIAGAGNETLIADAGSAADFAFIDGHGGGAVAVTGFNPGSDRIVLAGYAPGTGAAALAGASVVNGSEILTLPDGTRITLVGFTGLTTANISG